MGNCISGGHSLYRAIGKGKFPRQARLRPPRTPTKKMKERVMRLRECLKEGNLNRSIGKEHIPSHHRGAFCMPRMPYVEVQNLSLKKEWLSDSEAGGGGEV